MPNHETHPRPRSVPGEKQPWESMKVIPLGNIRVLAQAGAGKNPGTGDPGDVAVKKGGP